MGGRWNASNRAATASQFATDTGLHTDGSNYLCCDGHVKWLRGPQVSSGYENFSASNAQDVPYANQAAGTDALNSDNWAFSFSGI